MKSGIRRANRPPFQSWARVRSIREGRRVLELGPREFEWTREAVSRFWDVTASREQWQEDYFSFQVGAGIASLLSRLTPLDGQVVDYGCGPGYLAERLLDLGVSCEGADVSGATIAVANCRLRGRPGWKGACLIDDAFFQGREGTIDLLICVETLEHLLSQDLAATLDRFHQLLRPGRGRLFISTPHAEHLARSMVFCPDCQSLFHRFQHISSFTPASLSGLLEAHGFRTEICGPTDFSRFQEPLLRSPLNWSPKYLAKTALRLFDGFRDQLSLPGRPPGGHTTARYLRNGPHLFWLGHRA